MLRTKVITSELESYRDTQKDEIWVPRLIENNRDPLQSVSFDLVFKHRDPVVLNMDFPESYPFTPTHLTFTPVPVEIEECCIGNQFVGFIEDWSPIYTINIQVLCIYSLITDAIPIKLLFGQSVEDLKQKREIDCALKRKRSAESIEDPNTKELFRICQTNLAATNSGYEEKRCTKTRF